MFMVLLYQKQGRNDQLFNGFYEDFAVFEDVFNGGLFGWFYNFRGIVFVDDIFEAFNFTFAFEIVFYAFAVCVWDDIVWRLRGVFIVNDGIGGFVFVGERLGLDIFGDRNVGNDAFVGLRLDGIDLTNWIMGNVFVEEAGGDADIVDVFFFELGGKNGFEKRLYVFDGDFGFVVFVVIIFESKSNVAIER